jgi:hypothetical protein
MKASGEKFMAGVTEDVDDGDPAGDASPKAPALHGNLGTSLRPAPGRHSGKPA